MRISDWSSDVCSYDLQVRSQRAATDAAFAAYKQAVLSALEDVENAMVSLSSARARKAEFATAYEASNNAAILARSQYQAGLIDFQTLSQSENSLLNARNRLAGAPSDEVLELGRASCRERVCQYVSFSVVAVVVKT